VSRAASARGTSLIESVSVFTLVPASRAWASVWPTLDGAASAGFEWGGHPSLISRANHRQNPDGEGRGPPRYPDSAGCRMRGTATDIHTFRCIKCGHAETMFVEAEDAPESPLGSVDIVCPACRQSNRIVKPTGLLIKRVTLESQKSW
jgi:DNA-directed RNA polymerase subunit RPC12/RpoP